jgi:hypothetical protein
MPYFGFSLRSIGGLPTMWPPMLDPLTNPTISPKLVQGIVQVGIVTYCGEPSDEDEDYFERKHNIGMPQIIFTEKPYHDQKGRPSLIGDASRPLMSG